MRAMMTVSALLVALALSACSERTVRSIARGGLIGGGIGLVSGAIYGDPIKGAARGAVLGAATGAIVGTVDDIIGY